MEVTELQPNSSYLCNSAHSSHDFSSTCSISPNIYPTADDKQSAKSSNFIFTSKYWNIRVLLKTFLSKVYDRLNEDDLKKLKERILQEIFHKSNILVELLQERQKLSEEAHFRLISIEQLHKLLETSCCYQRILLSWLWLISIEILSPCPLQLIKHSTVYCVKEF